MLKLLLSFLVTAAFAQSPPTYLLFATGQAACLARSQAMCTQMGCNGTTSKFWWDCSTQLKAGNVGPTAVPTGTAAMRIDNGTAFGATAQNLVSNGVQGLAVTEQSQVVPAASISSLVIPRQ